jgi:hypothetical protein
MKDKICLIGLGHVGLSDIAPIQKKHDVNGLFYENITKMSSVIAIIEKVKYIKENYSELTRKIAARIKVIKKEENEILAEYGELIKVNNGVAFDE